MKTITILLTLCIVSGCNTMKETTRQAKNDWSNFRKTIRFNAHQPVVYKNSYF